MSATLTRRPETETPVSQQAPKKVRRWILVAAAVAIAGTVVSITGTTTDDQPHRFAETGRHDALGRASQRADASSEAAEFTRQLALAPVDGSSQYAEAQRMASLAATFDTSVQFAETQRQLALAVPVPADGSSQHAEDLRFAAIGAGVDNSIQYAETQRFLVFRPQADTSHDVAELQRMRAFDDNSWEEAEARRFATLDPSDD